MRFSEFITRQRTVIFVIGIITFALSLIASSIVGFSSEWGELYINLAASSITIIFTAFIIDYLRVKETFSQTQNATSLAEDEITATCFRIKWRLARLFGLEHKGSDRENISNSTEAVKYLGMVTEEVDTYLQGQNFVKNKTKINEAELPRYIERLQLAQTELEQALILFEYATPYDFRERVLALRKELQFTERIIGFIDFTTPLNNSNKSIIRVTSQSVYDAINIVLSS